MKKITVLVLFLSLLLCGCGFRVAIDAANDVLATAPELERVETVIHLLHSETTEYPDGREEKKVYEYHPNTSPLSCTYSENGTEIGVEEYTCDEHLNITSITRSWEGGEPETFTYTYDENGHISTQTAYQNGELNYKALYTYDDAGNITVKEIHTDSVNRLEYTYDSQNRVTECRNYLNDALLGSTVTSYNEHGKRRNVTSYDGDGTVNYYEEYSFNAKSSVETVLEYMGDGTLRRKLINTYDAQDRLMMQQIYTPGEELLSTTYLYHVAHRFIDYAEITEPTKAPD